MDAGFSYSFVSRIELPITDVAGFSTSPVPCSECVHRRDSAGVATRFGMRNNSFCSKDVWLPIGSDANSGRQVGFGLEDLERHLAIFGQTGTGKSTLIGHLAVAAFRQNVGITCLDPHGQLAEQLLLHVPRHRFDDVVYLDASDESYSVAIDWLGRSLSASQREGVASAIVSAFKGIWYDSWGPRLEMILSASVMAVLEVPQTSLLALPRLLDDERYRSWVVKQVQNPSVRYFFNEQMGKWDRRQHAEFIGSVQNKLSRLFLSSTMRHLFGQVGSKVCFRRLVDERRILIANLARGKIGEDHSAILGAILVAMLEQAAMSRADIDESLRQPHIAVVDEFATFTTLRFATALSQIRKYKLSLVLAAQYMKQLSPAVADAVFGNVGTVIAMRTNTEDVELFKRQFGDEDRSSWWYSDLPNYAGIVRRMHLVENPWKMQLYPPATSNRPDSRTLRQLSRERFGVRRDRIEQNISKWMGRVF